MIGSLRASVLGAVKLTRIWLAGDHESQIESLPRVNKGGTEQEHSELRGLRRRLLTTGNTAVQLIGNAVRRDVRRRLRGEDCHAGNYGQQQLDSPCFQPS